MNDELYGRVKFWRAAAGWGFLSRDDQQGDVFAHAHNLQDCDALASGDRVKFTLGMNRKNGKTEARNIIVIDEPTSA